MTSFTLVLWSVGILLAYTMGIWLPWDALSFFSALFPAALFLFMLLLPESPTWLYSVGRDEEASAVALWLFKDYQREIEGGRFRYRTEETSENIDDKNFHKNHTSFRDLDFKAIWRPLRITTFLLLLQQLTGSNVVIFYTVTIFQATKTGIDVNVTTIVVGVAQLIANIFSIFIVEHLKRKPLLYFSGVVSAGAISGLGLYFYLLRRGYAKGLEYLPVFSLCVLVFGYACGYGTVSNEIMAEVFPQKYRRVFGCCIVVINYLLMFAILMSFPYLVTSVHEEFVFGAYAVCTLIGLFFIRYFLSEVGNRPLQEIDNILPTDPQQQSHD